MKLTRHGRLSGVAILGAIALTACGSDNNSSAPAASNGGNSTSPAISCASGTIQSSGSTAQANAISEWIKQYQTACGSSATINYAGGGSGQGVTDFVNGQTAFAGSDSPLNPDKGEPAKADARCKTGKAVDLPMVPGPIAVVFNLSGVSDLTLTPSVLAQIYSGKITKWNDPAIAAANTGVTLPATAISTVHRSDSSGTTNNFTKYLTAAAASDWAFASDKQWKAPGGQGAKGSDGVSATVKSTPGAIGYVEYSYATNNALTYAKIDNGGGAVALTPDAVAKAVAAATVSGTGDDLSLKLDYATKTPGAYPIILVTYEITCEQGLNADQAKLTKSFLTYVASAQGQSQLTTLGYAPLPTDIQQKVSAVIAKIS